MREVAGAITAWPEESKQRYLAVMSHLQAQKNCSPSIEQSVIELASILHAHNDICTLIQDPLNLHSAFIA